MSKVFIGIIVVLSIACAWLWNENQRLREKLSNINKKIIFPSLKYCTDNADMIAFLAEKKINNNSAKIGINFSAYSRGMVL